MTGETAIILADLPVTPCLLLCHPSRLGFPFVSPLSPLSPLRKRSLCTRTRFYAAVMRSRIVQGGNDLALSGSDEGALPCLVMTAWRTALPSRADPDT